MLWSMPWALYRQRWIQNPEKINYQIIPNYAFAHYSQDRRWMGTGAGLGLA